MQGRRRPAGRGAAPRRIHPLQPCRSSPGPRGTPGRLPWGQLLCSVPPESLGSHRGLLGKAPAAFAFGASRDGRWQRSRTRQPVKAEEDDRLYLLEIQTSVYNPELQHSEEGSGLFFFSRKICNNTQRKAQDFYFYFFSRKIYPSRVLEAVTISHDFPLAGVRMFGNGLALRMCPVTERSCVSFRPGTAAKQKSSTKRKLGKE